jgi:putative Holliday junction resolvase
MSEVETNQVITLTDESGQEHEFEVLEILELESKTYTILQPLEGAEEEAIILRLEKDADGNDSLVGIEDDEEWEKVAEAYDTLLFEDQGGSDADL